MSPTSAGVALARYDRARDAAAALLDELRDALAGVAPWHGSSDDDAQLARTIARLRDGRFVLAVVGEFSSGKSFLLNALLGKVAHEDRAGSTRIVGLLATDINPSTATITELSYGDDESATAYFPGGREERIPLGRLARFVAIADEQKLHDATADTQDAPTLVRVRIDSPFLAGGFIVADTPGLASINPAHRRATLGYLPGADAVLYLVDTQQPFTDGDATFLGIVRRYIESIFIVQTKIDLWRMRDGDRETWETARARIVAQGAIHAPDVPVFPLSAREYAEGTIAGDAALIERSRFPALLAALDVSLVATTGRARLRRAAADARRIATRGADALALEIAALELDASALERRAASLEPTLVALDIAAGTARARLRAEGAELRATIDARGMTMREGLRRALARAFDIADIARLRDRAKLHLIVDETLAAAIGTFAADVADLVAQRLPAQAQDAVAAIVAAGRSADVAGDVRPILDAIAREELPLADDAATLFAADAASGAWSAGLASGLRSTIVLGALGGPAVGLVHAISARFAAHPYGAYMKRELLADLGAALFDAFDADVRDDVARNAARVEQIALRLADRLATLATRTRSEALGAIDRACAVRERGDDAAARIGGCRERSAAIRAIAACIDAVSNAFAHDAENARDTAPIAPADASASPASAATPVAAQTAAHAYAPFDPLTYEHGLRPERWRVAVIGALRRGKSSLINALAGARILADEGGAVETRFPIHVRYGPESRAYALGDDAGWDAIPLVGAMRAAQGAPVLIETPWSLPPQLVLVHTPAFDSGQPDAETIAAATAASASELVVLFSRQLSDRELAICSRFAELGKPMSFAHTLADNEAPGERRNVVALADRYVRERGIAPQRIYTVSANDYRRAREANQAPAGWNELGALATTLATHAEEHMAHLARAERERAEREFLAMRMSPVAAASSPKRSFFDRFRGRH